MSDKPTLKEELDAGTLITDSVETGYDVEIDVDTMTDEGFVTRTARVQMPHPHDHGPEFDGRPSDHTAPDLSSMRKIEAYIEENMEGILGADEDQRLFWERIRARQAHEKKDPLAMTPDELEAFIERAMQLEIDDCEASKAK